MEKKKQKNMSSYNLFPWLEITKISPKERAFKEVSKYVKYQSDIILLWVFFNAGHKVDYAIG